MKFSVDWKISAILPFMPYIFVGRDDLLTDGVNYILSTTAAWIAILGYGGMGKTTLALAILHHQEIKAIFGNHSYFVPCDVLKTAQDLVIAVLQILGSKHQENKDYLSGLQTGLLQTGKILLVLDNFETLWAGDASHRDIQQILEIFAGITTMTVIITMRGNSAPQIHQNTKLIKEYS